MQLTHPRPAQRSSKPVSEAPIQPRLPVATRKLILGLALGIGLLTLMIAWYYVSVSGVPAPGQRSSDPPAMNMLR